MILGAVAAFLYGIWAGLGTWDQSQEEIDRALSEPGRRRKATRHFTPLDLMARMTGIPTQRDRRNPFRFGEDDEGLADPRKGSPSRPAGEPGAAPKAPTGSETVEGGEGYAPEGSAERRGGRGIPPSTSDEGVDDEEGASDDGAEEVPEPDDHS